MPGTRKLGKTTAQRKAMLRPIFIFQNLCSITYTRQNTGKNILFILLKS